MWLGALVVRLAASPIARVRACEELDRKRIDLAEAGDYAAAARIRDQLSSAQLDDEGNVLQANVEFYEPWPL